MAVHYLESTIDCGIQCIAHPFSSQSPPTQRDVWCYTWA